MFADIHKIALAAAETVAQLKLLRKELKESFAEMKCVCDELQTLNANVQKIVELLTPDIVGIGVDPGEPTEH